LCYYYHYFLFFIFNYFIIIKVFDEDVVEFIDDPGALGTVQRTGK